MDIGLYGSYHLPAAIKSAYGVETAQELADQLGVTKKPSVLLAAKADGAYKALKKGDSAPARALLVNDLGVPDQNADSALAKLPKL